MDGELNPARLKASLLDESLPTPLYHQIYLVLRERIQNGLLAAGATLPGEQELSKTFNVSRITVKRALNELAADRLVTRHRGRGTIVAGGVVIPMVRGSFDNLIESLKIMGLETDVELLEAHIEPADSVVAGLLHIASGAPVQFAVRLRKLQGEPFSYLTTFVPAEIAEKYTTEELATTPILTLLERAGAPAFEAEQWISAAGAEPKIAAALGVDTGSPLLMIERVMFSAHGAPIQLIRALYRPDRFQYHFKSKRRRQGEAWT